MRFAGESGRDRDVDDLQVVVLGVQAGDEFDEQVAQALRRLGAVAGEVVGAAEDDGERGFVNADELAPTSRRNRTGASHRSRG